MRVLLPLRSVVRVPALVLALAPALTGVAVVRAQETAPAVAPADPVTAPADPIGTPAPVVAPQPVTPAPIDPAAAAAAADARLGPRNATILGLVEGVTEFLPVSSTGHLIITNHALGLEDETPLRDETGAIRWWRAPDATAEDAGDRAGVPLTRKLAADTFAIVIQAGAILAVVILYWGRLVSILRGLVGRDTRGLALLRNIVVGFMPAAVVGLAFDDLIEKHLFSTTTVIAALVVGAALMVWAERWRRARPALGNWRREPADLTVRESLVVGCMQTLALWPGMSRSMVTMVGGYFAGLSPARAAEFSFLLGLPTLGGAAFLKAYKAGPAMIEVLGWGDVLLGVAVATVSAALAVKFLVGYLGRHGLDVFAAYRVVLAVVLVLALWRGWLPH